MEYYIKKREEEEKGEENKYIIFRPEIGKGSYSKVYKGMNKKREYIGIKIVNIENMSEEIIGLIEKEIEIHKKIENENIVKLNDVIRKNKKICMIMEYCETDLEKKKYEILEEYNIDEIFKQLNNAIKYLHENNIKHRDLKPSNILIKDKNIKLADFGFASNKEINMYETLCGSPLYMAPELLKISLIINENKKNNYDSKCDIWSYGLILYECIYLNHPYSSSISILDLYNKQNKININYSEENKIKKRINPEFIELLKLMLKINNNERISWKEFFNHPFIINKKNILLINENISKNIIINIENKENKVKKEIIEYSKSYQKKREEMIKSEIIENYIKKESEDYIIIKKEDLINSEINRERTVKDNIYYFLSNSVEYAKKPFKYFSF